MTRQEELLIKQSELQAEFEATPSYVERFANGKAGICSTCDDEFDPASAGRHDMGRDSREHSSCGGCCL
jgi:hypothetical protein